MKDKTATALLAFFLGFMGVHRFYLRQTGLGILYFCLMFVGIGFLLGFIDFIVFLAMDQREFDFRYNRAYLDEKYGERGYGTDFDRYGKKSRRQGRYERNNYKEEYREERYSRRPQDRNNRRTNSADRLTAFKKDGIRKYKEFDYEGAIEDFQKALEINPKDKAVHFNLACAYSLLEEKDEALQHLSEAVKNGFTDFDRIASHDALAFLRIQDEYDAFVKNGYSKTSKTDISNDTNPGLPLSQDIIAQLKQLGELKERGLLTPQEFEIQKQRLLKE